MKKAQPNYKLVQFAILWCFDYNSRKFQLESLRILEKENQDAAQRLEAVVRNGQDLLEKIQAALSDIAQAQLDMQHLTKAVTGGREWWGKFWRVNFRMGIDWKIAKWGYVSVALLLLRVGARTIQGVLG